MHRIDCHGLQLATNVVSSCGDSLFNTICCLVAAEFDVQSLRLYTIQSFCNAIISDNQQTCSCLHQHLSPYLLENMSIIGSWQEYLVNMALPYEKGNVEGCRFCLQGLSIIFRVNIQVWSALPDGIVNVHATQTTSNLHKRDMLFSENETLPVVIWPYMA
jgi:hypothetical protein